MGKEEKRVLTLDKYEHGVVVNALNEIWLKFRQYSPMMVLIRKSWIRGSRKCSGAIIRLSGLYPSARKITI